MKKCLTICCCLLGFVGPSPAQDITGLEKIGPVVSFTRSEQTVLFSCRDNSQVRVTVLAPDLVRIRASLGKPLPARDHSWAIEKTNWTTPRWSLSETTDAVVITTDEIEVVIRRSPLLIEFRDLKTRKVINADEQPMAYDAKGLLKGMMFDPEAGSFVAASKKFGFDEHFYGLGEKAAKLDKRRNSFINWNSDTPGYNEGKDPIYQTVPFYLGLENAAAYGIFFDNSYRSYFDFAKSSQQRVWFGAEGGELNYYFFYGPSIKKILGRYSDLTGHMPLPPLWALGNQQSRWSYYPDTMVEEVAREYRRRDLPLDVIHLDIDYMQAYRVFTWDTQRFPNPKALSEKLTRIEGELTQLQGEGGQDALNFPGRLDNQFVTLYNEVAGPDGAPTAGSSTRFEDLKPKYSELLGQLKQVLDTDVANFNQLIRSKGAPPVILLKEASPK